MLNVTFVRTAIVIMLVWPFAWDYYVHLRGYPDLTITHVFRDWARENPFVSFSLGAITSHLLGWTVVYVADKINGG
jgi:hypothetical protein